MNTYDILNKVAESPSVRLHPFRREISVWQIFLYLPAVIILGIGIYLELSTGFNLAFQRAGAAVVCWALVCAYMGYRFQYVSQHKRVLPPYVKAVDVRTGKNMGITPDQARGFNRVKSGVVLAEFHIGILGTIVWGFGDIPFN
ncbi:hypothetical protein ACJJIQ_00220 (plasmid) [Microbulbifer sp. ANSA003]|uniref:hypothetical protein n=1 Tax=Microbulbifer sp. ANSA003 TaxID=3243360 RepID=UPI0040412D88